MKRVAWIAAAALGLICHPARAQVAPPPVGPPAPIPAPAASPAPSAGEVAPPLAPAEVPPVAPLASDAQQQLLRRVVAETAAVRITDSRGAAVTLRVPAAIHRPANAFRLWGARPLTLKDRNRRRDLYRDAFMELATRPHLGPEASAWDSLGKQVEWVAARGVSVELPGVRVQVGPKSPQNLRLDEKALAEVPGLAPLTDLAGKVTSHPAYRHVSALSRALGYETPVVYADEPVAQALRMRALATDAAEQRLLLMGAMLGFEKGANPDGARSSDPALREGYLAARAEFEEVRKGLWPALAQSLRKNQGRLLLSAAKQMVLSRLGFWAVFGHLGWQGVEGALNVEYQGQLAISLATLACELSRPGSPTPQAAAVGLYAQYALNRQLTEALKRPQILELQPAGGRTAAEWQIHSSARCDELRRALTPGV